MKIYWKLIMALVLMTGCGKQIPGDIIQPQKMENVLYDYHLTIGMTNHLKNTEKEAYKKYIFQKYQVTEETFDSSMVWYTREAQELAAIYDRLEKRFKREHSHAEAMLKIREGESISITSPGDTVNIWNDNEMIWMTEAPLMKRFTFEFKTDSNFHPRDKFLWDMDFHFFAKGKAILGMSVTYENDSVVGETRQISQSGRHSISLTTDSAYQMKTMNGFIYIPNDSLQNPNILINNIKLMRYHREQTDSVSTDSISALQVPSDNQKLPKEKRLQRVSSQR